MIIDYWDLITKFWPDSTKGSTKGEHSPLSYIFIIIVLVNMIKVFKRHPVCIKYISKYGPQENQYQQECRYERDWTG